MSQGKDIIELAAFQKALLDILLKETNPNEIRKALLINPNFEKYKSFIEEMDDKMIATAAEIIKKWHK